MQKALGFLLLFLVQIALGQNVDLSGEALFFKNEPIQIFKIENALTKQKTLIAEEYILADGSYQFKFNLDHAEELIIKIEMREIRIKIHPNSSLKINFFPIKYADNQRNPLKYEVLYHSVPPNTAVDSIYQRIEIDFANLQLNNTPKGNLNSKYDSFFSKSDSTYNNYIINDSLFNNYYTYLKAEAYLQTDVSKQKLINHYILAKPVLYGDPSYLRFFKFLMNTRLNNLIAKNGQAFQKVKDDYQIYNSFMDFAKTDVLLQNEEIRSLAILLYINGASSNHNLTKEQKASILNQISNFCAYPLQKEAALFLQSHKKYLKPNAEAPHFKLLDKNGNEFSLESFKGHPVYLGFIHSQSGVCQRDLKVIETLKKKYKKVKFLMVITDRDSIHLVNLPPESQNLKYLFLNNEYEVLEKYQIWSYPVYFLLNAQGYFIQAPAKSPSEMFEFFAHEFVKKSKRKSYEIISN